MSFEPDDDPFDFTILMATGHILFDCGYVAEIAAMFDEDGEITLEREEAATIAFAYPSDLTDRKHYVIDLYGDDCDVFPSIH